MHAKYIPICVVNPIGVDARSENVPMTQNKVKGQLGDNTKLLDKTLLSMSSPVYKASIKFSEIVQNVMEILVVFNT